MMITKPEILMSALSVLVLTVYVVSYCVRLGIPNSISASYYNLKHHILFTLTMWSAGALIVPGIMNVSKPCTQWFGYIAVLGLFIVGAAPRFLSAHQRYVHIFGAALAIAGTTLWVVFMQPIFLLFWVGFAVFEIACLLLKKKGHPIFAAEITVLVTFYTAFFVQMTQSL